MTSRAIKIFINILCLTCKCLSQRLENMCGMFIVSVTSGLGCLGEAHSPLAIEAPFDRWALPSVGEFPFSIGRSKVRESGYALNFVRTV